MAGLPRLSRISHPCSSMIVVIAHLVSGKLACRPLRDATSSVTPRPSTWSAAPRQEVRQGERHDLGRLAQVGERQALVGAVRVGLLDRVRAGAVEHDRDAGDGVVAGVGVERDALVRRRVRP